LWAMGFLFLAGCAASGQSITTPVRPGPAVNAPAYRNGDQWHYRNPKPRNTPSLSSIPRISAEQFNIQAHSCPN
jgi:hypothetical protein